MPSVDLEIHKWKRAIAASMLRLENAERQKKRLTPLSFDFPVQLSDSSSAAISLMNFKVWVERYKVSLDFILKAIFDKWRNRRRIGNNNALRIGLSVSAITGTKARFFIEEEILKIYPCGENMRHSPQFAPVEVNGFHGMDDFVTSYGKEMRRRQLSFVESSTQKRNYRR